MASRDCPRSPVLQTLFSALAFLLIAAGLGCLLVPPRGLLSRQADGQAWALEEWLLPLAPGIGLWVCLQFILFEWLAIPAKPWIPALLALAGHLRLLLQILRARHRGPAQAGASSANESASRPGLPGSPAPAGRVSRIASGCRWGHPKWLALILLLQAALYCAGSLPFPLVGIDPWGHAMAARYVAETGSLREPIPERPMLHYLDAYPPGFPVLVGNSLLPGASLSQVVMLVTILCATLALAWFHSLARLLYAEPATALAATAVLAVLPSFLSRHPWGHAPAVGLLVATFFYMWLGTRQALELAEGRAAADGTARGGWPLPVTLLAGALCLAGIMLLAPSKGLKAAFLALLLFVAAGFALRRLRPILALSGMGLLAGLLVVAAWLYPMLRSYGNLTDLRMACDAPVVQRPKDSWGVPEVMHSKRNPQAMRERSLAQIAGTGDRVYNSYDFFGFGFLPDALDAGFASAGCGGVAFVLALLGLWAALRGQAPFSGSREWRRGLSWWLLATLLFTIAGLFGARIGVQLFPWRFWLLLSIPVALLAPAGWKAVLGLLQPAPWRGYLALLGLGVWAGWAVEVLRGMHRLPWALHGIPVLILALGLWILHRRGDPVRQRQLAIGSLLLVGLAVPLAWKIHQNTRPERRGGFLNSDELAGYHEVGRLLGGAARVYPLAGEVRFQQAIGVDLLIDFWKQEDCEFARVSRDWSPLQKADWLAAHGYTHVLLDPCYGVVEFHQQHERGRYSFPVAQLREAWAREGLQSPAGQDPYEAALDDKAKLRVAAAEIALLRCRELLASGAFELRFSNNWVHCLAVVPRPRAER